MDKKPSDQNRDQTPHNPTKALGESKSMPHSHIATVIRPPSLKNFANRKTCQITEWSCWKHFVGHIETDNENLRQAEMFK